MADTGDAHALEIVMKQGHQSFADDFVFFAVKLALVARAPLETELLPYLPINRSAYWERPILLIKSAHSSTVHSEMMVSGRRSALL